MRAIIELLRYPDRIAAVELEADDAGSIDDVLVRYREPRELRIQVKFAVDETDDWTWETLLKIRNGTGQPTNRQTTKAASRKKGKAKPAEVAGSGRQKRPLLYKWFDSLRELPSGIDVLGEIVTNRGVSDEVAQALDADKRLVFDRIPLAVRDGLAARYGGAEKARAIAEKLRFYTEEAGFEELEAQVRDEFSRRMNAAHYLYFKDQVRTWGRQQKIRRGPKVVDLDEARRASRFYDMVPLPEQLEVPDDFVVPDRSFDDHVVSLLGGPDSALLLIEGDAGAGKSTYVSDLYRRLRANGAAVVRHHFWLSTSDPTPDRVSSERVFATLMDQLYQSAHELLGDVATQSPEAFRFREWLEAAGQHATQGGRSVIVLIDGLDHALADENRVEASKVLAQVVAPHAGIKVLIATRPTQYPAAVRDRDQTVLALPRLGRIALGELIRKNADSLRVADDRAESPREAFDRLVDALTARTGGLALHVRIAVRILRGYRRPISAEDVHALPESLAQGAANFYRRNWKRLDVDGRLVLHLLTEHRLPWLRSDLQLALQYLDLAPAEAASAIDSVQHLLDRSSDGTLSINYSLYTFIAALDDHRDHQPQLERALRDFLADARAPESWRWGYLPELQLRAGEISAVIDGLNREWFVAAIALGRSPSDVRRIAIRAMQAAVRARDICGFVTVGILFDYYDDIHNDDSVSLLEVLANRDRLRAMPSDARRSTLASNTLRDLVLELQRDGLRDVALPFYNELRVRVADAFARENPHEDVFLGNILPWLAAAGALGEDADRVALLVAANLQNPYGSRIASCYLEKAGRFGHHAAAEPVLTAASGTAAITSSRAFARGAMQHGSPLSARICEHLVGSISTVRLLLAVRGEQVEDAAPRSALPGLRPGSEVADVRDEWLDVFHDMVADAYSKSARTFDQLYALLALRPSMHEVADELEAVWSAFRVFPERESTTIQDVLTLAPMIFRIRSSATQEWREEQSVRGFRSAICDALLDCAALRVIRQLKNDDVRAMLEGGLTVTSLAASLEAKSRTAGVAALEMVVERLLKEADGSLDNRESRAAVYRSAVVLARALGRRELAAKAAHAVGSALMSLGYHKDMYLSFVLQVLRDVGRLDPTFAAPFLDLLAPPIANIGEFTDSDHTRYFPEELGEALMELDPERFAQYYLWLVDQENLFTIQRLLTDHLFSTSVNGDALALLRTVRDVESI